MGVTTLSANERDREAILDAAAEHQRKRSFGATQPERCREAGRKGGLANTWHRGEGNPKAKLTAEDADFIRADPRKTAALAELYGVNRTTIQRIRRGDLWPVLRAQSEAR